MIQRALCMMESSVRPDATLDHRSDQINGQHVGQHIGQGELDEAGRYVVEQLLGRGAFGRVFLAHDTMLRVQVAVKVIERQGVALERALAEARAAAKLNHPNIVPVRDTGVTSAGQAYIVLELIRGRSLGELLQGPVLAIGRAVELVLAVTRAAGAAHLAGIVHRDLKPGNILIDATGKPCVTDFGLAYDVDNERGTREIAGTPGYMAPEQLRGEIHRIDARTDVWAIGAILFETLTGQRAVASELQRQQARSTAPLIGLDLPASDRDLPPELVAICHRCLAFSQADRYQSAFELADDLQYWIDSSRSSASAGQQVQIVPKGLRSFDESDREFFLRLLPGPRDRFGLPESIRFWKQRIETRDPATVLSVGVCYGSSGCGKSSLIRAGLLPQLTENVTVTWVAATPLQTEVHLLERLRRGHGQIPADMGLVDTLAWVRARNARHPLAKTLIVLDQFEQWLTPSRVSVSSELVNALRHCDGHVACLLIVRDEYWLSLTRFMQLLEIPLRQGQNVAMVDLFEKDHAVRVLEEFGSAWEKWPEKAESGDPSKQAFLDTAVEQLASDGRVPCIHLVFLAEALRQSEWTTETLRAFGGASGCMQRHLDGLLARGPSTMRIKAFETATRQILTALIPASSGTIKGEPKSRESLIKLCEPTTGRQEAEILLEWMVQDLRLITRQDQDLSVLESPAAPSPCYQLTHDFLVGMVRSWLQRRRQGTLRGMAQVLLEERTRSWQETPTSRFLPGFFEWLMIRGLVRRRERSDVQQKLLLSADRFYLVRSLSLMCAICIAIWVIFHGIQDQNAKATADKLFHAEIEKVPEILERYTGSRPALASYLRRGLNQTNRSRSMGLKVCLGLVCNDEEEIPSLIRFAATATPAEIRAMSNVLKSLRQSDRLQSAMNELWRTVQSTNALASERLRAAALVANYDSETASWTDLAPSLIAWMVAEPQHLAVDWVRMFSPVCTVFNPELQSIVNNTSTGRTREVALIALIQYETQDSQRIIDLIPSLQPEELTDVVGVFDERKNAVRTQLRTMTVRLQKAYQALPETRSFDDEARRDQSARQISTLILTQAHLGDWGPYLDNLKFSDEPRVRTFLIHDSFKAKLDRERLWQELTFFASDSKLDAGICQGLLLAFGDPVKRSGEFKLTAEQLSELKMIFRDHPDAGVHSAVEWLLRCSIGEVDLESLKLPLISHAPLGNRNWYIIANGLTFAVIQPGVYQMGQADWLPFEGSAKLVRHDREVSRRFAISTTEVTGLQFAQLKGLLPDALKLAKDKPQHPLVSISQNDIMKFCLLLTRQEQMDAASDCYEPAADDSKGLVGPKATCLDCEGYRMPTEGEVEYALRSGTKTLTHFGYAPELLNLYEWHGDASGGIHPVARLRPNCWGLFDSLGNVSEMCQDSADHVIAENSRFEDRIAWGKYGDVRIHGGMYSLPRKYVLSAYRFGILAKGEPYAGFRIVRTLPQ